MKAIGTAFLLAAAFWIRGVPAVAVQRVQLGSSVTLSCNLSYLHGTTWLRHNPDRPPTVLLVSSLREGRLSQACQSSPRYSVSLTNRSLGLTISGVEEGDLGLYYCAANVNSCLAMGGATRLQGSQPDALAGFHFHHLYCVLVGSGLLLMVLAVCVTHWRTRRKMKKKRSGCRYRNTWNSR